jgi:hypothetical protein
MSSEEDFARLVAGAQAAATTSQTLSGSRSAQSSKSRVLSPPPLPPSAASSSAASAGPSASSSQSTSPNTLAGERLFAWGRRNQERLAQERRRAIALRERDELAGLTFRPDLSATTSFRRREDASGAGAGAGDSSDAVLARRSEWDRRRQERLSDAQYEALLQEASELTFAPQISLQSQATESRLPEDVKAALRSIEGFAPASPNGGAASSARRREALLQAFLHRQAKARAERELKQQLDSPRNAGAAAASPRFTGAVTVPTAPVFATAQRAAAHEQQLQHQMRIQELQHEHEMRLHGGATSPRASPARRAVPSAHLRRSAGAPAAFAALPPGSPVLVALSSLQQTMIVPGSSLGVVTFDGAVTGTPAQSDASAAAWRRVAPELAELLARPSPRSSGGKTALKSPTVVRDLYVASAGRGL